MPLPYKQNKKHIYKWIENNKEYYLQQRKKHDKKYRCYKRECIIFRNILIDIN